ncbi:hypothetical protein GGF38_005541 [Coemansia sp. RSA 25]|nr:hypothetical protein GGF38_005541 [Coemansia sp. RSA 25]
MYHQPQLYQETVASATASSARHMYMDPHGVRASSGIRYYSQQAQRSGAPAALVLPPLTTNIHPSVTSSPPTCYSPGLSHTSDAATVVDYSTTTKSPTLSYASSLSKTASPAPPATATSTPAKDNSVAVVVVRRRRGARSMYSAEEKEMRRKISHSAIEKRRRERTNNVLKDLQVMVPWLSKSNKVQKLEILEAAAQYIKDLRASSGGASSAAFDHSRLVSSGSSHMDDEDEELLLTPVSTSPRAMKVNFLLS